eukprot:CAMPEP_0203689976 /NCGR_PEP_ID=MMETSP0091-20130426/2369_1 /ASSEMBLY_ACC=CAM_ASM_001089 /TAXON_ID=426623 /ORGANISM="Chaetoceros affinis, Strain CCMP159" /LENGTH=83 /DNA_ID=CAMNT_0050559889 /DNA_START=107 /DNA_END=358 /DNA_ORIENTATION=+
MKSNKTLLFLSTLLFYTVLTYSTLFFYTESSANLSSEPSETQTKHEENLETVAPPIRQQRKVNLQPVKRVQRLRLLQAEGESE